MDETGDVKDKYYSWNEIFAETLTSICKMKNSHVNQVLHVNGSKIRGKLSKTIKGKLSKTSEETFAFTDSSKKINVEITPDDIVEILFSVDEITINVHTPL